jgi:adenylate kinase family enzyme
MKRVAVFGNAGGGKSTLARKLAVISGLPLFVIDHLQFRTGGAKVPHEEYLQSHTTLLAEEQWIIDGFGCTKSVWERFEAADTLVHVDLPLPIHALWVTKRLIEGIFVAPHGWPKGSPIIRSSISSYKVLWPCHTHLTPKYRTYVAEAAPRKRVIHLRSKRDIALFLDEMKQEYTQAHR